MAEGSIWASEDRWSREVDRCPESLTMGRIEGHEEAHRTSGAHSTGPRDGWPLSGREWVREVGKGRGKMACLGFCKTSKRLEVS